MVGIATERPQAGPKFQQTPVKPVTGSQGSGQSDIFSTIKTIVDAGMKPPSWMMDEAGAKFGQASDQEKQVFIEASVAVQDANLKEAVVPQPGQSLGGSVRNTAPTAPPSGPLPTPPAPTDPNSPTNQAKRAGSGRPGGPGSSPSTVHGQPRGPESPPITPGASAGAPNPVTPGATSLAPAPGARPASPGSITSGAPLPRPGSPAMTSGGGVTSTPALAGLPAVPLTAEEQAAKTRSAQFGFDNSSPTISGAPGWWGAGGFAPASAEHFDWSTPEGQSNMLQGLLKYGMDGGDLTNTPLAGFLADDSQYAGLAGQMLQGFGGPTDIGAGLSGATDFMKTLSQPGGDFINADALLSKGLAGFDSLMASSNLTPGSPEYEALAKGLLHDMALTSAQYMNPLAASVMQAGLAQQTRTGDFAALEGGGLGKSAGQSMEEWLKSVGAGAEGPGGSKKEVRR